MRAVPSSHIRLVPGILKDSYGNRVLDVAPGKPGYHWRYDELFLAVRLK
jgi:hypothetical protein